MLSKEVKEKIKETIATEPLKVVIGVCTPLLTALFLTKASKFGHYFERLPSWLLLVLVILEFVIILGLAIHIRIIQIKLKATQDEVKRINKLRARFGIYWDHNNEPICPKCEKLLAVNDIGFNAAVLTALPLAPQPKLNCVNCKQSFALVSDHGAPISLSTAKASFQTRGREV